jgi:outer membrane protein OmpA-like peptidoglycan-associated protein
MRGAFAAFALLLGACAQVPERVILLPDGEGRTGALVVRTPRDQVELATAYAAAEVRDGSVRLARSDPGQVEERYGELLKVAPARSQSWTLYFHFDRTEMTAASRHSLARIIEEIRAVPNPQIEIVGHADRAGADDYNSTLSLRRAHAVRDELKAAGLSVSTTRVIGCGESESAVATRDGVPEPRNRRVEIRLR